MKILICLALLAGCTGSPVDAAGQYTIGVTNRENGCNFANYTVGQMASGIMLTITEHSSDATADVMGGTAVLLDLSLGSHTFAGTADGDTLNLRILGTRTQNAGSCTYTYAATLVATLTGDTLTGRIEYLPAYDPHSQCGAIAVCVTDQDFNGTRPPR
jgi:hypothetical protein